MKILVDASVLQIPATGIGKSTAFLYKACTQIMPDIDITAIHQKKIVYTLPTKIKSVQFCDHIPSSIWLKLAIPIYSKYYNADIIHFPWNGNVPKHLDNFKIVTTIHDVLPLAIPNFFKSELAKKRYRRGIQNSINRSDLVITDSLYSKKQILDNFEVSIDPVIISLAPTIDAPKETINVDKTQEYFIYVGGRDKRKGVENLVKIFIGLKLKNKISSKLLLTGDINYYSNEFKQLIEQGIILNIIEEVGYVQNEMLQTLISNATALIYPSKYEGFGLPPLEAMALGTPVITTRCTSIPEVCGNAVYYIDPDNVNDFENSIISLEKDLVLRRILREKGLKQANKFSWEKSAKLYLNEIEKI